MYSFLCSVLFRIDIGETGRKFHDDNPNITRIRVIRSRRRTCAGHIPRLRHRKNAYKVFEGKPEGTESFRCQRLRM
jgi:hypothetical protein